MAYSKDEFILKEATIQYGSWANPHALTPASDPKTAFTATDNFGYIRMGTVVIGLNDTFVQYKAGTPHKIIRQDLLERMYNWQFTCNQLNANSLNILYNMDVDSGAHILGWVGNDAPVKTRYGFLMTGKKVDGTAFYAAIWEGEVVTEDKSMNFPGTDYVDIPVLVQAFEGPTFVSPNDNDEHNYGMIFYPASS